MKELILKSDKLGIIASSLCMVHCIATPFLFIAKSCSATCCSDAPQWWSSIDYLFIIISFFAVWQTSKTSSESWVKYAFWLSWAVLLTMIVNEGLGLILLSETTIYLPALVLIALHFYNLKYCQCITNGCCTETKLNYE